jgi:hypothetical protein
MFCIDTLDFSGSLVHAIPESRPAQSNSTYQLSFLGDYIVAQLVSAVEYVIEPACKDDICNLVPISVSFDQAGNEISAPGNFDFGDYSAAAAAASSVDRWGSSGYTCVGPTIGNGIIIYKDGDTFEDGDEYEITLEVLIGSSANGTLVDFNTNTPDNTYWTSSNSTSNCNTDANPLTTTAVPTTAWAFAGTGANLNTKIMANYTVTATEIGFNAILVDLPQIDILDVSQVSAGQKIYLNVSVVKLPCGGEIVSTDDPICLAELVSSCPTSGSTVIDGIAFIGDRMLSDVLHGYLGRTYATGANTSLFFPYAPALNDAGFFTGLCIANTGTNDVVLTITLQGATGGTATYTSDTVKSGNQFVTVLDTLIDDLVDGATALDLEDTVTVSVAAAVAP